MNIFIDSLHVLEWLFVNIYVVKEISGLMLLVHLGYHTTFMDFLFTTTRATYIY